MNQSRTIRLPIHVAKELNVQLKATKELTQKLDHEPTLEEISEYLGKPVQRVSALLNLSQKVGSIDHSLSTNSDATLLETIPDQNNQGPEKIVLDANLMSNMEQWVDRLSDIQKKSYMPSIWFARPYCRHTRECGSRSWLNPRKCTPGSSCRTKELAQYHRNWGS